MYARSAFTGCLPQARAGESLRDTPAYQSSFADDFIMATKGAIL